MDFPSDGPSWDEMDFDESEMMAPEEPDDDMIQEMIQDQEVNMVSTNSSNKNVPREEEITRRENAHGSGEDMLEEEDMAGGSKVTTTTTSSIPLAPHLLLSAGGLSKKDSLDLYSFSRYTSAPEDEYRTYKTLDNTGAASDDHRRLLAKKRAAEERRRKEGGKEEGKKVDPRLIAPGVEGLPMERNAKVVRDLGVR